MSSILYGRLRKGKPMETKNIGSPGWAQGRGSQHADVGVLFGMMEMLGRWEVVTIV